MTAEVVAGLLVGVATFLVMPGRVRRRSRPVRGAERVLALDPAVACDLVAIVVSSGASVPDALVALGAATDEPRVAVAGRLLRLGAPWQEAVHDVPARWRLVVGPLRGAWENGVDPAAALAVAAASWRSRRAAHARQEAERLAVRLVLPLGLCLLPAFVLLGLVPVVLSVGAGLLGAW